MRQRENAHTHDFFVGFQSAKVELIEVSNIESYLERTNKAWHQRLRSKSKRLCTHSPLDGFHTLCSYSNLLTVAFSLGMFSPNVPIALNNEPQTVNLVYDPKVMFDINNVTMTRTRQCAPLKSKWMNKLFLNKS